MNHLPLPTSHVSVRLDIPPSLAVAVFDAADPSTIRPDDRIELLVTGSRSRPDALRVRTGVLTTGRVARSFPVELELAAWSPRSTELSLRITGRRRPTARFADAAAPVIVRVADELELRALLALHPAHGTGEARQKAGSAWL